MSLTSTEWVIAGATLVGPILAVQAQKWVERARARRARKANVFGIRPGRSCAPGYSVPNLEGSFGMGVKTPAVRMTRPRHISKTAPQTGLDPCNRCASPASGSNAVAAVVQSRSSTGAFGQEKPSGQAPVRGRSAVDLRISVDPGVCMQWVAS